MRRRQVLKFIAASAILSYAFPVPAFAAVEVAGVKFDDTATVAGKELKLNGAGLRTKVIEAGAEVGLHPAHQVAGVGA